MSTSANHGRRPDQLPAGRHGIPREVVVRNQKERIFRAVIDVTSVAGYGQMSVEDIISTAGVSRRTFYDYFPNKQAVFLACVDQVAHELREAVQEGYDAAEDPIARATACISALTRFLAEDPARAEMALVEILAAGQEAIAKRNETMDFLADLVVRGTTDLPGAEHVNPLTAQTIVGGISEVLYTRVVRGETDELEQLVPDLVHAITLPYLGFEAAEATRKTVREQLDAEKLGETSSTTA
ncbi:TetR/AcrR family transcriptional regulator [Patulibacter defluvii]|uniref:TetR/AcrR family transcriptional regulator n=1 Tax=Patulibacter defluvii TaxID=3095358 RepID=UPI002A766BB7|nr:TetR/AcrR family transcriptional regulator [Patulibacter sp. DM4]